MVHDEMGSCVLDHLELMEKFVSSVRSRRDNFSNELVRVDTCRKVDFSHCEVFC